MRIGVASLNSAWRCSSDKDSKKLLITDWQIESVKERLESCVLRLALLHHPFPWYHPSQHKHNVDNLKRSFDIILTGHLHQPTSLGEVSPDYNCLSFTCPAIQSSFKNIGYNIYQIDFEAGKLTAIYRQYIEERDVFDQNIRHAEDGKAVFTLPGQDRALYSQAALCKRIGSTVNEFEESIQQQLAVYQREAEPILVRPYVKVAMWKHGELDTSPYKNPILEVTNTNAIICGPEQSGKSIFLQLIAADYDKSAVNKNTNSVAVYVDLNGRLHSEIDLEQVIDTKVEKYGLVSQPVEVLIRIDNMVDVDEKQLNIINDLLNKRSNWKVAVALSNPVLFEALGAKGTPTYEFYMLPYWGPSRIREFTRNFCGRHGIDVDTAYEFIVNSLRQSDLPNSPITIALYLYAFLISGEKLSSLSFLEVLRKIESHRLGVNVVAPQQSVYFKQQILMRLAVLCYERDTLSLDLTEVRAFIIDFFGSKSLKIDVDLFLQDLHDTGFVHLGTDKMEFRQYVFYDYYLALACKEGILNISNIIQELHQYIESSDTIALYCGMDRFYSMATSTLLDNMKPHFNVLKDITLSDLDSYIEDLLEPLQESDSSKSKATEALEERIDYEDFDEDFESDKADYVDRRKYIRYLKDPTSTIEQLSIKILALKAFYNTFRNLEAMGSQDKLEYLDRVLDYHIDCNMGLIKFFAQFVDDPSMKTVVSYLMTIGGQNFLSANIANQSLEEPIVDCLESSTNDFKQLLLVCLHADLRLTDSAQYLKDFAEKNTSRAAAEIIYLKIMEIMRFYEGNEIPTELAVAFESSYRRRQELQGTKMTKGAIQNALNVLLREVRIEHDMSD